MIRYNVSVQKEGRYLLVATFTKQDSAIAFAAQETKLTGKYHLVEVIDGGKH